jgi:hypothetical protein
MGGNSHQRSFLSRHRPRVSCLGLRNAVKRERLEYRYSVSR